MLWVLLAVLCCVAGAVGPTHARSSPDEPERAEVLVPSSLQDAQAAIITSSLVVDPRLDWSEYYKDAVADRMNDDLTLELSRLRLADDRELPIRFKETDEFSAEVVVRFHFESSVSLTDDGGYRIDAVLRTATGDVSASYARKEPIAFRKGLPWEGENRLNRSILNDLYAAGSMFCRGVFGRSCQGDESER